MNTQDTSPPTPLGEIEFWFEFGSNYSYLSVMRIEEAAALRGVRVAWKPFLLGPIFKSFGWDTSPFVLQKEKGIYMWKDMERQCRKYDLPWTRPSTFPRASVRPMKIAAAFSDQAWIGLFCKRVMLLNFALDRDIDSPEAVAEALEGVGPAPAEIVAEAQSEENRHLLRAQTEQARARGIFGAPTFFANGEMFWGNDRLDDALELAAQSLSA